MSESAASDRFVTVAFVYSPSDLALLASLFEHEDILLQSIGRGHASVELGLTTALGGVALRVHEVDADDARRLLAEIDPLPYRGPAFTGVWALDLLFFAVVLMFGMPPPPRQVPCFLIDPPAVRRGVD